MNQEAAQILYYFAAKTMHFVGAKPTYVISETYRGGYPNAPGGINVWPSDKPGLIVLGVYDTNGIGAMGEYSELELLDSLRRPFREEQILQRIRDQIGDLLS